MHDIRKPRLSCGKRRGLALVTDWDELRRPHQDKKVGDECAFAALSQGCGAQSGWKGLSTVLSRGIHNCYFCSSPISKSGKSIKFMNPGNSKRNRWQSGP